MRHAKPGAWPHYAEDTLLPKRLVRPAQMEECIAAGFGNRMAHSSEIINERETVHAEFLANARGPDYPWIIGEANDFAADWPGNGDSNIARQ